MAFPNHVLGVYSLDWAGLTHQLNGGEPVSLKEAVKEAALAATEDRALHV